MFSYTDKDGNPRFGKIIGHGIGLVLLLILFLGSWVVVGAGERGVVVRLGQISRTVESGFHFKVPLIESVDITNVQVQKEQADAEAASADLQDVHTTVAVNYHVDPKNVATLYQNVGTAFGTTLIDPAIQEAVKASTAKYTAEELITKREQVKDDIQLALTTRLAENNLTVDNVSIVSFQFSPTFNDSIEKKVTAEQDALAAKNKLAQVQYEADQRVAEAKGEAQAIAIQAQAITSQGGAEYVQLQWINAWEKGGSQVPQVINGAAASGFLLNLNLK